jgi:hypothetical protein
MRRVNFGREHTMNATETIETEASPIAQPDGKVLYMSRRRELTIVHTPMYPRYGPGGQVTGQSPGRRIEFHDGVLRVDAEDTELVEWLDNHQFYGDLAEGFWRVELGAPVPTTEELEAIMDAAVALDAEALQAIVDAEAGGYKREAILRPAQGALDKIATLAAADPEGDPDPDPDPAAPEA